MALKTVQPAPPLIGVTLGDPAGIGPEIVEKASAFFARRPGAPRLHLIGSAKGTHPGKLSIRSARHALEALEASARLLKEGTLQGVVNAPIHKANIHRVGFRFPGQTEFYAARAGMKADAVTMMLASDRLIVSLVTIHLSLKRAIANLTPERIVRTGLHSLQALRRMGIENPRLAVAGLNPHAGEGGAFGNEESRIIAPAIQKLRRMHKGIVSGPISPDTVFHRAVEAKEFDAVLCMYHDQGLIPLKLTGFDTGVNLTLGTPFWRGAPDHGTATDIAGTGTASASSMIAAIQRIHQLALSGPPSFQV